MKNLIEIVRETFFFFQSAIYTLIGFFIRPSDHPAGEKNPVVLVPGLMGSQFVWRKLRKKLVKEGYPVYVPHLDFQVGDFRKNGKRLEDFIVEKNLRNVYIIAHSSGGIIATQMGYRGRDRVRKLFAVATPFHGTWLALFIFFIPAGRQLIPWSSFMRNNEINFMTFFNLQSLYSRFDLTIIPRFQARLGRNDDALYDGIGHLNIFMSRPGVEFIYNLVAKEEEKMPAKPPARVQERSSGRSVVSKATGKPQKKSSTAPKAKGRNPKKKAGATVKKSTASKVKPSARAPKKKI